MAQRYPVTTISEIPAGSGKAFTVGGQRVAVFNVGGKFHAMDDTCPHAGAPLSEGRLNGCVVTCPWHAIEFDVTNGKVPGQSEDSLSVYPVFVNGDKIEVEV